MPLDASHPKSPLDPKHGSGKSSHNVCRGGGGWRSQPKHVPRGSTANKCMFWMGLTLNLCGAWGERACPRARACAPLGVLQAGALSALPDARVAGEAEEVVGVRGERHVASRRANSGRRRRTSARASARAHRWAAGRRALECRQAGGEWGGRRPPSSQVWRRWTANLQQCSM